MSDEFVLWGGYGGNNLGDEAILWAMSRLLRKLRPSFRQSVLVRNEPSAQVMEQYRRWEVAPVRLGSMRSLYLLRSGRLVVGGGQLLDDTGSAWPVGWTSLVLSANAFAAERALILCIGAEPIVRKFTRAIAKNCYGLAGTVSCRDSESVNVVKNLGIPNEKVVATRDVVFSLDSGSLPRRGRPAAGVPRVTLVVAHDAQRTPGKSSFYSELARFIADAGCNVCLVAHDLRMEYDYGLLLVLEREFENDPRITISKPERVEDVLQEYADSDAVISGRMHPLILSSLVRSLPVAIPGTRKVGALIKNLGLPVLSGQESGGQVGPGQAAQNVLTYIANKDRYLQEIAVRISEFGSSVEETTAQALTR